MGVSTGEWKPESAKEIADDSVCRSRFRSSDPCSH